MCWVGFKTDRFFSEEDKVVFKVMYKEINTNKYYSPIRGFEYEPNKLYKVDCLWATPLVSRIYPDKIEIESGLHTFSTQVVSKIKKENETIILVNGYTFEKKRTVIGQIKEPLVNSNVVHGDFKLVFLQCIIPKNTEYYSNSGEIVSTKLIMTEKEVITIDNIK